MPKLFEITDAYMPEETIDSLPVEQPVLPTERPRIIINTAEFDKPKSDPLWDDVEGFKNKIKSGVSGIGDAIKYASELDQKFTSSIVNFPKKAYENSDDLVKGIKNLLGLGEEERYQLWPEKVVKEALTSAGDIAKPNPYPEGSEQWQFYEDKRQEGMVPAAMAISALAGSGGLAGTGAKAGEVALGATPFLRPALKHKDKLYKGKPGQEHQDIIPKELYEDFRSKAMSGEDLAEYNFGFINDKGYFLDREKALKYGIDTGLIDPHSGKFGALTTTLMADSSKPGVTIEAMAKTGGADIKHFQSVEAAKFRLGQLQRDKAATKKAGYDVNSSDYMFYNTQIKALKNFIKNPEEFNSILKADSSKEAAALQANKPAFYSAVEHTVNNIPQAKMTGEQWLGTLSNKPGVKPEELDWTGLKSFLEENKGKPVTKQQIEEHLASNKVELKEVRKGQVDENSPEFKNEVESILKLRPNMMRSVAEDMAHENILNKFDGETKYQSYQLPGGENYREMLLTLPTKDAVFDQNLMYYMRKYPQVTSEIKTIEDVALAQKHNPAFRETSKGLSPEEVLATARASEKPTNEAYKSSHWDEPNILAHVRMNDRYFDNPNNRNNIHPGKDKSLHLEEIQSDWHQQGRDKGYKGSDDLNKFNELDKAAELARTELSFEAERTAKEAIGSSYAKFLQSNPSQAERTAAQAKIAEVRKNDKAYLAASDKVQQVTRERDSYNPSSKLPDAPFKKTWHELALKRMIREAAEKGYDRLSWTPGEAQAARYDLSKQLKELQYLKNEDGTYSIAGVTKDGGGFNHPDNVPASKLPDIVGKEMAEKIVKNEGKRARGHPANGGYFEGVDLKVGGEGMKGFYDQIIPKSLEKLGKEHGVKVKKGKINSLDEDALYKKYEAEGYDAGEVERLVAKDMLKKGGGNQEIFYIDIPQSLKDTAMKKGFPLFSSTPGYMFVPFDGDPFKDNNK